MSLGMGHVGSFFADHRLGQYGISQQFIAVCHLHGGVRIRLCIALHDGNAQKSHTGTTCFRLHDGRIHCFQPDGIRR